MNTKRAIGIVFGALTLAGLALASGACAAQAGDPQEQVSGAADVVAPAAEGVGEGGFAPYCPRQWSCPTDGHWYAKKADCVAACGEGLCYADANCSLPGCTCP